MKKSLIYESLRELSDHILGESYVTEVYQATDIAVLLTGILAPKGKPLRDEPALMDKFRALRHKAGGALLAEAEAGYLCVQHMDGLDALEFLADLANPQPQP